MTFIDLEISGRHSGFICDDFVHRKLREIAPVEHTFVYCALSEISCQIGHPGCIGYLRESHNYLRTISSLFESEIDVDFVQLTGSYCHLNL